MLFRGLTMVMAAAVWALLSTAAFASTTAPTKCPRPAAGSNVAEPVDLYSSGGVLSVTFDYVTSVDRENRTLFCFITPDGVESPTLHLNPGDTLKITLQNMLPTLAADAQRETMSVASDICGSPTMDATSVNIHFHGTNTSPVCHADEVIHTLVNAGQTFSYSVTLPHDEPPGLYWYHPHVHGLSEAAVQGGASGAIVVEGIQNLQPAVAKLPSRILLIRDQNVSGFEPPGAGGGGGSVPSWDVTLNYVPIAYPEEEPAVIPMAPSQTEFWRVVNASADTIIDLQVLFDGVAQPLQVVALDGVCASSQDGSRTGKLLTMKDIFLPPAGRAEFIVTGPSEAVGTATLETLNIATGPAGDNDPARTLAVLKPENGAGGSLPRLPAVSATPGPQRFEGLDRAQVTARRKLYFSETPTATGVTQGGEQTNFFITVDGAKPTVFSPTNPPAITTTQGAVEDWTIENRSAEVHEFHMHQIHFKLLARDGKVLPENEQQFFDTVQVPFWSGTGPYPSITVRMDFRGRVVGDFVYHCHILGHEDAGMMAIIRVLPKPPG